MLKVLQIPQLRLEWFGQLEILVFSFMNSVTISWLVQMHHNGSTMSGCIPQWVYLPIGVVV